MKKNKKKLKIAQIAPLWFEVPPKKYGGIERVVAQLCNGLVERGHDVTLFGAPGSKTKKTTHEEEHPTAKRDTPNTHPCI